MCATISTADEPIETIQVQLGKCLSGYDPILGWVFHSPGIGFFDKEIVNNPNFKENMKPKNAYFKYIEFRRSWNCVPGSECFDNRFDYDKNGKITQSDLAYFIIKLKENENLGDWQVATDERLIGKQGECKTIRYSPKYAKPEMLFQGCVNRSNKELWTDGRFMWVGPATVSVGEGCEEN